jgi:hypothetical protein
LVRTSPRLHEEGEGAKGLLADGVEGRHSGGDGRAIANGGGGGQRSLVRRCSGARLLANNGRGGGVDAGDLILALTGGWEAMESAGVKGWWRRPLKLVEEAI